MLEGTDTGEVFDFDNDGGFFACPEGVQCTREFLQAQLRKIHSFAFNVKAKMNAGMMNVQTFQDIYGEEAYPMKGIWYAVCDDFIGTQCQML